MSKELLDHFSKRREQVTQRVMELKASGEYAKARKARIYEIAALGSRKGKEAVSREMLLERWKGALQEKGWTLEGLKAYALKEAAKSKEALKEWNKAQKEPDAKEVVRQAAGAATERESVFYREAVLNIGLKLSLGEKGVEALESDYRRLMKDKTVKRLGRNHEGREVFTTKEMLKAEREILADVRIRQGTREGLVPQTVQSYLQGLQSKDIHLTRDQGKALHAIAETKDAVVLIQGDAGTGKTAVMAHVKTLMERDGWSIRGLAFTGKAAAELKQGSGIESMTLASFFNQAKSIKARELWVVDEASMIGSKDLYRLLGLAEKGQAKVVLIGDRKQFQAIEAGRMFSILQEKGHVQTVKMTETIRQKDGTLRETVYAVSLKEIDQSFTMLEREGRLFEISDRAERLNVVAREYMKFLDQGKTVLVLTALNQDRVALNHEIRSQRVSRGDLLEGRPFQILEPTSLHPAWAMQADAYKPGQVIVTTGKIDELKAGTRMEVVGIDPEQGTLIGQVMEKNGHQGRVEIDPGRFGKKLSVYQTEERNFSEGDRVVFLKNDRRLGIQNGMVGNIEKFDDRGNLQVNNFEGREIRFNLESDPRSYPYLTHAYALTEYKSQGQTVDAVIWHAQAKDAFHTMNTANSFYVSITRAREDAVIFTDSKEDLKEQVSHEQAKTSTWDYPQKDSDSKQDREMDEGKVMERGDDVRIYTER